MKPYIKLLLIIQLLQFSNVANASDRSFDVKIAIVDVQLVLEKSLAINNIKKSMETINESIHQDVSKKEVELKAMEAELVKKKDILGAEEFNQEVEKFNKKVNEIQQNIQSKKARLEQAHNEAFSTVHEAAIEIIAELSVIYGFNLTLPNSQVLFASNSLNITEEIIDRLNKKLQKVEIKY